MRGIWLATVIGLDWPPAASLKAETAQERVRLQKQGLTDALDEMVKTGINAVYFQVKPDGTALWRSNILPWSEVLTGTVGQDPGYDPLAFMLQEAHRRGINVHAWLNPYRVSMNTRPQTIDALNHTLQSPPASVYALHPDWIRTANERFVLDPGLPDVRNWITGVVAEIVKTMRSTAFSLTIISITKRRNRRWMMNERIAHTAKDLQTKPPGAGTTRCN